MNFNSKDTNKLLDTLNRYLHSGYLLKVKWRREYDKKSKKEGFSFDVFQAKHVIEANNWIRTVNRYLEKSFEEHYSFHFVQTRPDATDVLTYSHPVDRMVKNFIKHLFALEDIIVRTEEKRNLAIRQEIAEKEYEADILYKISFSWHTREIKLNNMLLSRPNSDSKNLNFFEYVYAHSNKQIEVKDIEKETAHELSNNIQDILRDLGFKRNIRKVFFPIATKSKVMFVNPITKQYAIKNDLPSIKLPK